jgi:glucuronokinase
MNGRCVGFTVSNFWATVTLRPSERLQLTPHPLYDPLEFASLNHAREIGHREGFYGGVRLLMATIKRFAEFCQEQGLILPKRNFTVTYDTNIPRQVGLAGSSAIITAFVRAMMKYYELGPNDVSLSLIPSLVLSVEAQELGINAGLQDRVAQVYEGLMHMDLSDCYDQDKPATQRPQVGKYSRLPLKWLEGHPFFVAFARDPSDSGKIHSDTRARWLRRDPEVEKGVQELAQCADQCVEALGAGDRATLADLMDRNFSIRRRLYGDACLGAWNLEMIRIARENGAAAKFPGSGGAVLGLMRPGQSLEKCRAALESAGCVFVPLTPVGPRAYGSAKHDQDGDQSTTCADPRSEGGDGSDGNTVRTAWHA